MKVAVIGAGPAGLTSAKQAQALGHEVRIYEKYGQLGGIWNPESGGAYPSVKMQSSKLSFHFSDFPPPSHLSDFPTLPEVYGYLLGYAKHFGIFDRIRFSEPVTQIRKEKGRWLVSSKADPGKPRTEAFDWVMVANGELWHSHIPNAEKLAQLRQIQVKTAKDYYDPKVYSGHRVLVVGGGVSGADIAAEIADVAQVHWSVRSKRLFLPRFVGSAYNDALSSYVGRVALQALPYGQFKEWLTDLMPDYMAQYEASGLLPTNTVNNAIHVNDRIIPCVAEGRVQVRGAFEAVEIERGGAEQVHFQDGSRAMYDSIIFCTGYQLPDYSFISDFDAKKLYEHFVYLEDPTLTIINTPAHTEAFGTACPYFEMIAAYGLKVMSGKLRLPSQAEMEAWCQQHLGLGMATTGHLHRYYYDCWLETIRLGLMCGQVPNPEKHFNEYWQLVSGNLSPSNLSRANRAQENFHQSPTQWDAALDLPSLKLRLLKSLPKEAVGRLVEQGQISVDTYSALQSSTLEPLPPELPYPKPPF